PLITRASGGEVGLPAQTAGALVRYDPAIGMFDVSYAAAWELGRLLALQSKQLSVSLYNWKRANAQALRTAETWLLHPSWVGQDAAADSIQLPSGIVAWFDNLRLLRGVPFNYLVPDERMLPPESIRFFQVDHPWIDCLIDGAFSIGRLTGKLKDVDREQKGALAQSLAVHGTRSGFLLRSSVVAGWPGLLVDARLNSAPDATKLTLLRMDRLSSDVLLCLFSGEVARVEIHQKPETLHFGVPNLEGDWKKDGGVVDIRGLAETLRTGATSAEFASRVVEGVPRVAFTLA
ncbi:MAG: hypothetical protein ACJ8CR_00160, partial [Roseiflexaceae bacterium]